MPRKNKHRNLFWTLIFFGKFQLDMGVVGGAGSYKSKCIMILIWKRDADDDD